MKSRIMLSIIILMVWLTISERTIAQNEVASVLAKEYVLGGNPSHAMLYYSMETVVTQFSPEGKPEEVVTYRLLLTCSPQKDSKQNVLACTCKYFSIQVDTSAPMTIPSLEGWSYIFRMTESGLDEKGQIFGIDHSVFDGLQDAQGIVLTPEKAYMVYNTFIDFHSFCNALGEKTTEGKGIQDLHRIGDKIIHASSYTEPPVDLGSRIKKGSTFKNGEVTLELKGIGKIDKAACAIVGFDSGQSSFRMIMEPMPDFEIKTVGGSHYSGDLFVDLASQRVRKVVMREVVVSETIIPPPTPKINAVAERTMTITAVTKEQFTRQR